MDLSRIVYTCSDVNGDFVPKAHCMCLTPPLRVLASEFCNADWAQKNTTMALPGAEKLECMRIHLDTIAQRDGRTEMSCQDRVVTRGRTWHSGLNHKFGKC